MMRKKYLDGNHLKTSSVEPETDVIFRVWKSGMAGGSCIALFVRENGTNDPRTCSSYEHIGQHGSAHPEHVMKRTRPARIAEWVPLFRELEQSPYGYRLNLLSAIPFNAYKVRAEKLTALKFKR